MLFSFAIIIVIFYSHIGLGCPSGSLTIEEGKELVVIGCNSQWHRIQIVESKWYHGPHGPKLEKNPTN